MPRIEIRLDDRLHSAVTARASATGRTVSEHARAVLAADAGASDGTPGRGRPRVEIPAHLARVDCGDWALVHYPGHSGHDHRAAEIMRVAAAEGRRTRDGIEAAIARANQSVLGVAVGPRIRAVRVR